jgi:hypothetical protein
MVENTVISGITGEIVATNVSFEEYLEQYAAAFLRMESWHCGKVPAY